MNPQDSHSAAAGRRRGWVAWAVAFACWTAFVWGHSLVQGPDSTAESDFVVALLRPLFEAVGVADEDVMSLVVRKAAHFTEYAILGYLGANLGARLRAEKGVPAAACAALVAAVPVVDECIQLGVPGRCGSPLDVALDLAGAATGALVARVIGRALRRRAKEAQLRAAPCNEKCGKVN